LLSIAEAADFLGIKKSTVYKYTRLRTIPHVRLGARILFDPERLDAWVRENSQEPKPQVQRKGGIYGEF
jgi:excisionase family DNA binding protein